MLAVVLLAERQLLLKQQEQHYSRWIKDLSQYGQLFQTCRKVLWQKLAMKVLQEFLGL